MCYFRLIYGRSVDRQSKRLDRTDQATHQRAAATDGHRVYRGSTTGRTSSTERDTRANCFRPCQCSCRSTWRRDVACVQIRPAAAGRGDQGHAGWNTAATDHSRRHTRESQARIGTASPSNPTRHHDASFPEESATSVVTFGVTNADRWLLQERELPPVLASRLTIEIGGVPVH